MKAFFYLFFSILLVATSHAQNIPYFSKAGATKIKFNGVWKCPTKMTSIKDQIEMRLEYKERIKDTLVFKWSFEDLFGMMGDEVKMFSGEKYPYAFLKVINDKIYIEYEPGARKKLPELPARFQLLAFNAPIYSKWYGKGFTLFFHNEITIMLISKRFDYGLVDSVYTYTIRGDRATSHTSYLTQFSISKLYGFTRLQYDSDEGCLPIFYSEGVVNRRKLKRFVQEEPNK